MGPDVLFLISNLIFRSAYIVCEEVLISENKPDAKNQIRDKASAISESRLDHVILKSLLQSNPLLRILSIFYVICNFKFIVSVHALISVSDIIVRANVERGVNF